MQSILLAQVVLHALVLQRYGEHSVSPVAQNPLPSQRFGPFRVSPSRQDEAAQIVDVLNFWHCPIPSQKPLFPHEVTASAMQLLLGSVPAATFSQ
jgi:hypothetical protein